MTSTSSDSRAKYEKAILSANTELFGCPHIVVDDLFSHSLLEEINKNWPKNGFVAEVKGNSLLGIRKSKYSSLENSKFWADFNENHWPFLLAAIAKKFEPFGMSIFGENYADYIGFDDDHPLTLMEANEHYEGHGMHTHFYHAPHWAFTVLIYVDQADTLSEGTSLHSLQHKNGNVNMGPSYFANDPQFSTEVAFDTFRWLDPEKPERTYKEKDVNYKANRLLSFMDGPLALHSVKDYRELPGKQADIHANKHLAQRRILRTHVKIHHEPFYKKISKIVGKPVEPAEFMKFMAPNAQLSNEEQERKNSTLFEVYSHVVKAHSGVQKLAKNSNLEINGVFSSMFGRSKRFRELNHYSDRFSKTAPL